MDFGYAYGLFVYMDHFIPMFRLYGLQFYGHFAYMDHFSRDKRGQTGLEANLSHGLDPP